MQNWLLTIGVLCLFALIFAGVNIGMILLTAAAFISIAHAIMESIDERKKKKKEMKRKEDSM